MQQSISGHELSIDRNFDLGFTFQIVRPTNESLACLILWVIIISKKRTHILAFWHTWDTDTQGQEMCPCFLVLKDWYISLQLNILNSHLISSRCSLEYVSYIWPARADRKINESLDLFSIWTLFGGPIFTFHVLSLKSLFVLIWALYAFENLTCRVAQYFA